MPPASSLRPWCLLAATLAWLWASSVFTPWAADRLPRLWLYDTLFYLRYVLLLWAAAEAACLAFHWRDRRARHALLPLAGTLLAAGTAWVGLHSEAGLRWRVAASESALAAVADSGASDVRRRAGHFLVDSVRQPCRGQAWLWLGRPHGGGTGINLALVRSGAAPPRTPAADAFAFWPAGDGWWVAYQHAARYRDAVATGAGTPACPRGRILSRQREGLALVEAGRRALRDR